VEKKTKAAKDFYYFVSISQKTKLVIEGDVEQIFQVMV
jgi:hypothetical protein